MKIPNRQSSFLFCLCFSIHSFLLCAQSPTPRFWVSPASVRADFWQMFSPNAVWDTLRARADVFSLHVNALRERDTASIRIAAKKLRDDRVKVNIECGGLRPFSGCDSLAGERHAQLELLQMQRWLSRGGAIDFITMDSPINTMIMNGDPNGTCNWTVLRAAHEIVDYMKAVRQSVPNVTFALVEPVPWYRVGTYPNHTGNNYGDLLKTLDTVFSVVALRGERIDIFHSDSPYEYSENAQTQGWLKIKAVEDYLHARGIRHGRISNSQEGGFQSDQLFYERTLASFDAYKAIGGKPDEIEVWCWYDHPAKNFPESEQYTFSYTCNRFFEKAFGIQPPQTRAKFEPPDGRVYHGAQTMTYESGGDPLAGYLGALNDSTIQPAVRGLFMSIPGERGPANSLLGLKKFFATVDSVGCIPEVSLFFIGQGATDSIIAVSTQYDSILDSIITLSKNYGRRMFVRIGGEFNGAGPGWNGGGYHPYLYVQAFRKVVDMFAARGFRDSIATIWCYEPDAANDFDSVDARGPRWYPGDNYVDWFGLDVFDASHFDQSLPDYQRGVITKKGKSERFLEMARSRNKPVYMSETSAKGVNITADNQDGMNDWNNWFDKFWTFIAVHAEIKGFSYINANWPPGAYPGWGDARIQNNAYITSQYRAEMHKAKYIHLPVKNFTTATGKEIAFPSNELPRNAPNPFSGQTTISFHSDPSSHSESVVSLKIFDLLGREVLDLTSQARTRSEVTVQASQLSGAGVYLYRLVTPKQSHTKRMVLIK